MNWSALEQNCFDEINIYCTPNFWGGSDKFHVGGEGISLPNDAIRLKPYAFSQIGNDYLIESEDLSMYSQE